MDEEEVAIFSNRVKPIANRTKKCYKFVQPHHPLFQENMQKMPRIILVELILHPLTATDVGKYTVSLDEGGELVIPSRCLQELFGLWAGTAKTVQVLVDLDQCLVSGDPKQYIAGIEALSDPTIILGEVGVTAQRPLDAGNVPPGDDDGPECA